VFVTTTSGSRSVSRSRVDDLSAVFAVALLKIGLATGFVEQRYPGFAKEIEVKRQRVIAALTEEQRQQKH